MNQLTLFTIDTTPTERTPWDDHPQSWESGVTIGSPEQCHYDGQTLTWGGKSIIVTTRLRDEYLSPRVLVDCLQDNWQIATEIKQFLEKYGASKKETISKGIRQKQAQIQFALEVGCDVGLFEKVKGGLYK
jgi:hypothetical protein